MHIKKNMPDKNILKIPVIGMRLKSAGEQKNPKKKKMKIKCMATLLSNIFSAMFWICFSIRKLFKPCKFTFYHAFHIVCPDNFFVSNAHMIFAYQFDQN
jgi:hypothetical protein